MRARELLASSVTADGATLSLFRESDGFVVRLGNQVLMGSRSRGSEQAMAQVAAVALAGRRRPRVLVGGLGMGFTLRSVLDAFAADAEIVVVELMPCVVEWNRGVLAPLSQAALEDPRVSLETADVGEYLASAAVPFDAILLDVDNGPEAFSAPGNARLYGQAGLATARAALRPGGVAVVWSAFPSSAFEKALARAGFTVETLHVRARGKTRKGSHHTLFIGRTKPV